MKRWLPAFLSLLLTSPIAAVAAEQLVPAGSLVACTISEPHLSSKTVDVGDPVLCRLSNLELYGRSAFPYGSLLEGRFEAYKDPGHLVGKGWMQLVFDRVIIQPDTVIPLDVKVVGVHGFRVDRKGRILGKGHPTRDIFEWSIPILWPIDLLNLPRRGPRPTLKNETRLTLKVMDDLTVPTNAGAQPYRDDTGLMHRAPTAYERPPEIPPPVVIHNDVAAVDTAPAPEVNNQPPPPVYLPRAPYVPRPPYFRRPPQWMGGPRVVTIWRDGLAYRTIVP